MSSGLLGNDRVRAWEQLTVHWYCDDWTGPGNTATVVVSAVKPKNLAGCRADLGCYILVCFITDLIRLDLALTG